jgi:hypothetical protein
MPLLCCDVGLVSELRLTAGCVLIDRVSPAVSGTSVYASGLTWLPQPPVHTCCEVTVRSDKRNGHIKQGPCV